MLQMNSSRIIAFFNVFQDFFLSLTTFIKQKSIGDRAGVGTHNVVKFYIESNLICQIIKIHFQWIQFFKEEKNFKGSLDSILSPSLSVKIQIVGGKVCLWCKGKTLLGIVNNLWKQKVCWHHQAIFCLSTWTF